MRWDGREVMGRYSVYFSYKLSLSVAAQSDYQASYAIFVEYAVYLHHVSFFFCHVNRYCLRVKTNILSI